MYNVKCEVSPMITCKICNKEMKQITNKHLNKHNLTVAQYRQQYPNAELLCQQSKDILREKNQKNNLKRKGIPRSEEVKQKISRTKQTRPTEPWNKGVSQTETRKQAAAATMKQKYESGEIIHWNTGKTTPEEVKHKISETALSQNRVFSEESKEKRNQTIEQKKNQGWVHPSTRKLQGEISDEAWVKLNDPIWLKEQHIDNKRTISSIAVELGLHWKNSNKTVKTYLEQYNIEIQYHHQTSSQQQVDLENFIQSLGIKIETKNRSIISPYELDIVIPDHNVAIEYCGLYWHSSEYKDKNYHYLKYQKCRDQNIQLITLYSDEWLFKQDIVKNSLKNILQCNDKEKINARSCIVTTISNQDRATFLNQYHIQGNGGGSITLGLHHLDQLVAVATFQQKQPNVWLLNRFASSATVRGGFSKIIKHFSRNYNPERIYTFSDNRWGAGHLYKHNNFIISGECPPDYEYVTGDTRQHKFKFRHINLPKLLGEQYDNSKSETENTFKAGIHKIYNCGLTRWELSC